MFIDIESLRGTSVLVTGAGGFIGSHLVESLVQAGCKVRALVSYNSRGFWGHLDSSSEKVKSSIKVVSGNIQDPFQMRGAVDGCDYVFHLAALIGIPYSYVAPRSYVETNVSGTINLLEAARLASVKRFIQTSTSEVYGTAQYVPMDEGHPLRPQSPYAATKVASDQLALSYYFSFELPVVVVRPFNTYGPRQSARAVVPTIVSQALADDTIKLGNVDSIRDLTYVDDTARGFLHAALSEKVVGEVVNLGTGVGYSVAELVEACSRLLRKPLNIGQDAQRQRPEASEVQRLISDPFKAERLMGWKSTIDLESGLAKVIEYVERHLADYKPTIYAT